MTTSATAWSSHKIQLPRPATFVSRRVLNINVRVRPIETDTDTGDSVKVLQTYFKMSLSNLIYHGVLTLLFISSTRNRYGKYEKKKSIIKSIRRVRRVSKKHFTALRLSGFQGHLYDLLIRNVYKKNILCIVSEVIRIKSFLDICKHKIGV